MKKIKELTIGINNDYVLWNVDISNIDYDCKISLDNGVIAYYVRNGVVDSMIFPGSVGLINEKKKEKNSDAKISLVASIRDRGIVLKTSVTQIKFHDDEINIDDTVGSAADVTISISDPWILKTKMGKDNIKEDELLDYVKAKFNEVYMTDVAMLIHKYGYEDIQSKISLLSDDIKEKFNDLSKEIGVKADKVIIWTIHFSDEYIEKRSDFFANQNRLRDEKNSLRLDKERAEIAKGLLEAMGPNEKDDKHNNGVIYEPYKFCSYCGSKNKKSATFCSCCGNRLD